MRTPVSVTVIWSESSAFTDGRSYVFEEFEFSALRVALAHTSGGYLKTKVAVLFSDGESYICRLDLAKDDDHNFRHHVASVLRYWTQRAKEEPDDYATKAYAPCVAFLQDITWQRVAA